MADISLWFWEAAGVVWGLRAGLEGGKVRCFEAEVGACFSPMPVVHATTADTAAPPDTLPHLSCTHTTYAEGCAAPTVAVLFEDTKEQRHVKTYEVSLREKVRGAVCWEGEFRGGSAWVSVCVTSACLRRVSRWGVSLLGSVALCTRAHSFAEGQGRRRPWLGQVPLLSSSSGNGCSFITHRHTRHVACMID